MEDKLTVSPEVTSEDGNKIIIIIIIKKNR
jgi:hypothetical protein